MIIFFFLQLHLISNLFHKIQENLGLNVNIQNKKNNSGKITILYRNLEQFELVSNLLKKNKIPYPDFGVATSAKEAVELSSKLNFPIN